MNFFSLVLMNLGRNKRRTILTMLSVVVSAPAGLKDGARVRVKS